MHIRPAQRHLAAPLIALIIALPALSAFAQPRPDPAQPPLPRVPLLVGESVVNAELANTDATRQTGLMYRHALGSNEGMLFVFNQAQTQCMWMKNTLIDLDVAFANEQGKILNVRQMKAGTTEIHCSEGNAKIALEMNRNWFAARGLGTGDSIRIPDSAWQLP